MNLSNKTILVTGGTGSFGKSLIDQIIKKHKGIKKLIIYSRDELKQFNLSKKYSDKKYKFLVFYWDVRDFKRLDWALKEVDIVIHAQLLNKCLLRIQSNRGNKNKYIGSTKCYWSCIKQQCKK